jgi:hypothetical protein
MALFDANGNQLTQTSLLALTTADPDPLVTLNEDIFEDVVYESGPGTVAAPSGAKTKVLSKGTELRTSALAALYGVPTVTAVAPANPAVAGGTVCTITGTGFSKGFKVEGGGGIVDNSAATVTFGGTAATNVVVNSDTQITCTAPAKTAGAVTVAVTTGAGTGNKANAVTYA